MNARQNIKLPTPSDITTQDKLKYDKASMFINENFKSLYDAVDEMSKTLKNLTEQLNGGNE